jgi:hypothetical protein
MVISHLIYSQGELSFDTHVWIVSKLLNEIKSSSGNQGYLLQQYVITTCILKMLCRLTHETLAKPFYDSLKKVLTFKIPGHLAMTPESATRMSKANKIFLTTTLGICTSLRVVLPKLMEQAGAATAGNPYNAYTKDTCIEFHELLCELLERFEEYLKKLAKYLAGDPVEQKSSYQDILLHVVFYGECLHWLVRSDAVTKHLQAIQPLLADPCHNKTGDVMMTEQEEEEDDIELASIQPSAIHDSSIVQPLWRSYLDWLMLVVNHFDVVLILSDHISGPHFPYFSLSIKILTTLPASEAMLS